MWRRSYRLQKLRGASAGIQAAADVSSARLALEVAALALEALEELVGAREGGLNLLVPARRLELVGIHDHDGVMRILVEVHELLGGGAAHQLRGTLEIGGELVTMVDHIFAPRSGEQIAGLLAAQGSDSLVSR